MRVPTEKQYATLRALGSGGAGLSWGKRHAEQFLRRGWVTAEWHPPFYQWVRITPDGLRALALAVERYGLPELGPPVVRQRVCGDCGVEWQAACRRCGGRHYGFERREVDVPAQAVSA